MTKKLLLPIVLAASACQLETVSATDSATSSTESGSGDSSSEATSGGDTDSGSEDSGTDDGGDALPSTVLLRITTPDEVPIGLAMVTRDGEHYFADNAGFLHFADLEPGEFSARVDAIGHSSSTLTLDIAEDVHAYREVRLFPLSEPLPLDATQGGTVTLDGVSVQFPPGSLVNKWGEPVYGMVEVTITRLDATREDIATTLPGPLVGQTAADEDVLLLSKGMMEISIWQDGQRLQLEPGSTARITFELPESLADALEPGDMILAWWLDLDASVWREESDGEVQLSQSDPEKLVWVAEVSHFTWYNADALVNPESFECYYVVVKDAQGKLVHKGFTAVDGGGVFVDGGYTTTAEVNNVSNCFVAPIDSNPVLHIQGIDIADYVVMEDGGTNLCEGQQGAPNPSCTKLVLALPPAAPPEICDKKAPPVACDYSGDPDELDVGVCQAGSKICVNGYDWSNCEGEVLSSPETCGTPLADDDCDGMLNDWDDCACIPGEMIACYTGPAETLAFPPCMEGVRHCTIEGEWTPCEGEVTPSDLANCAGPLEVEISATCADANLGVGTQLEAIASGGDGNYTWSWDNANTLDDAMISNPVATPPEITTYTATATDGLGNTASDEITVHLLDRPWTFAGLDADCSAVSFFGGVSPHSYADLYTTTCAIENSEPAAYVCDTVLENVRITGTMVVHPPQDDDDYIGFVWGWQNSDQFYMLHWKQAMQNMGGCSSGAGIVVKRFDRTVPYEPGDFTCNIDTINQTVLLTPDQTTTAGWVHGVTYIVELLYANDQTEITITDAGTMQVVANFIVIDNTYPSGQFGTYDYSQVRACSGPWGSSCL